MVIHWYDLERDYYYCGAYTKNLQEAYCFFEKKITESKVALILKKDNLDVLLTEEFRRLKTLGYTTQETKAKTEKQRDNLLLSIQESKKAIAETEKYLDEIEIELVSHHRF